MRPLELHLFTRSSALIERVVARGSVPTKGEIACVAHFRQKEDAYLDAVRGDWYGALQLSREYSFVNVSADERELLGGDQS